MQLHQFTAGTLFHGSPLLTPQRNSEQDVEVPSLPGVVVPETPVPVTSNKHDYVLSLISHARDSNNYGIPV